MEIIWKPVIGFEGFYEVSNTGLVKSFFWHYKEKVRVIKPTLNKSGYYNVKLKNNNFSKTYGVHALVALAFIEKPYGKYEVNHIDGNKLNNHVSNLEWILHKENIKHMYKFKKSRTNG